MSFDKIYDLTAGVYFNFYNIHHGVQRYKYVMLKRGARWPNESSLTDDREAAHVRLRIERGEGAGSTFFFDLEKAARSETRLDRRLDGSHALEACRPFSRPKTRSILRPSFQNADYNTGTLIPCVNSSHYTTAVFVQHDLVHGMW